MTALSAPYRACTALPDEIPSIPLQSKIRGGMTRVCREHGWTGDFQISERPKNGCLPKFGENQ